ncbi:hypothetical protein ON010_g17864 [Phytophthora cinnamomi]|nr:hypothetical protein ON010_g17864 [Phytophthora cinnamomi]
MSSFLQLPGVREALAATRQLVLQQPEAPREPDVIVIDEDGEPLWPVGVEKVTVSHNLEKIRFPDIGATDMCECAVDCFRDVCVNARTSYYCTAANCRRNGKCSNSLYECKNLELIVTKANGTGVKATAAIFAGAILGNYTGVLTTHDFEADEEQTCEYALKLQQKSSRRKKVYIDATTCGGMTRMMNHSCNAACRFVELHNRRNVVVVVVANRNIKEGEEVTVDYMDPWFECHCGEPNCRDRK